MPCNDISEIIRIELDASDRLLHYSLNKKTCGTEIGQTALLIGMFRDRHAEEILDLDHSDVFHFYETPDPEDEFFYFKHFFAVQSAVSALLGKSDSAPGDDCTTISVSVEADNLRYEGLLAVDALARKVKSCGHCGECGASKKAKRSGQSAGDLAR